MSDYVYSVKLIWFDLIIWFTSFGNHDHCHFVCLNRIFSLFFCLFFFVLSIMSRGEDSTILKESVSLRRKSLRILSSCFIRKEPIFIITCWGAPSFHLFSVKWSYFLLIQLLKQQIFVPGADFIFAFVAYDCSIA